MCRARRSTASPNRPRSRASANSTVELGIGHDDAVIRHIGALAAGRAASAGRDQPAFRRSHDACAHRTCRPDLWRIAARHQTDPRRPCPVADEASLQRLESDLGGKLSWQQIAAEFDLSVSYFSRAFRVSTGLPPHQWLLRQRVKAAKQLMTVRDLPLSEIAISAGFANQSHFTRVFSAAVGVSPAAWRREMHGTRGKRDLIPANSGHCPISAASPVRWRRRRGAPQRSRPADDRCPRRDLPG